MSDALHYELKSKEKSGRVAAIINIFLPGIGHFYAGSWIMGVIFMVAVALLLTQVNAIAGIVAWLVAVFDGSMAANRTNKRMYKKAAKQAAKQEQDQAA